MLITHLSGKLLHADSQAKDCKPSSLAEITYRKAVAQAQAAGFTYRPVLEIAQSLWPKLWIDCSPSETALIRR